MKKYLILVLLIISCEAPIAEDNFEYGEFDNCEIDIKLDLNKASETSGLIEFDIIPDVGYLEKGTVIPPKDKLWEKGIVNYAIQGNRVTSQGTFLGFEDEADREKIRESLEEFSRLTDIEFIEWEYDKLRNSNTDGAIIARGWRGGSSHLGKQGGTQMLYLPSGLVERITYHEFAHLLGVNHEFIRHDRDQYIKVHYENIPEGFHRQFEADPLSIDCGDFDIDSVMMYGSFQIQKDSTKVEISLINGETFEVSEVLSQGDIQTIKTLYKQEFKKR